MGKKYNLANLPDCHGGDTMQSFFHFGEISLLPYCLPELPSSSAQIFNVMLKRLRRLQAPEATNAHMVILHSCNILSRQQNFCNLLTSSWLAICFSEPRILVQLGSSLQMRRTCIQRAPNLKQDLALSCFLSNIFSFILRTHIIHMFAKASFVLFAFGMLHSLLEGFSDSTVPGITSCQTFILTKKSMPSRKLSKAVFNAICQVLQQPRLSIASSKATLFTLSTFLSQGSTKDSSLPNMWPATMLKNATITIFTALISRTLGVIFLEDMDSNQGHTPCKVLFNDCLGPTWSMEPPMGKIWSVLLQHCPPSVSIQFDLKGFRSSLIWVSTLPLILLILLHPTGPQPGVPGSIPPSAPGTLITRIAARYA